MPAQQSVRPDDDKRAAPVEQATEYRHDPPARIICSLRLNSSLLEESQLFSEEEILGGQGSAGLRSQNDKPAQIDQDCNTRRK